MQRFNNICSFCLNTEAVYAEITQSCYDMKENKSAIQTSKDVRNETQKNADNTHGSRLSSTDVVVIDNALYESGPSWNEQSHMALTQAPGEQYCILKCN